MANKKTNIKKKENDINEKIEELNNAKISLFNTKSLGSKFFISLVLFVICLCISVASLVMTIRFEEEKVVMYREKNNVSYEVCYKEDDFYHGKCFDSSNMRFIANLIKNIKLNYNYIFDIDEKETVDFEYSIMAKLSINDTASGKPFYEKEYPLVENKKLTMDNDKSFSINEELDIDYDMYNKRANEFNTLYGVSTNSKLTVYMTIHKTNDSTSPFTLNSSGLVYMSIPLSEKAVDIDINSKNFENSNSVVIKPGISIKNIAFAIVFSVFTILTLYYVINMVRYLAKMFPSKNNFEKYIARILREYDRLIGEAKNAVSFEDKEVIKFEKFTELLDIHDNLNLPIMYYMVVLHKEAYFYIVNGNIVYLYDAKASDIENSN